MSAENILCSGKAAAWKQARTAYAGATQWSSRERSPWQRSAVIWEWSEMQILWCHPDLPNQNPGCEALQHRGPRPRAVLSVFLCTPCLGLFRNTPTGRSQLATRRLTAYRAPGQVTPLMPRLHWGRQRPGRSHGLEAGWQCSRLFQYWAGGAGGACQALLSALQMF